MNRRCRVSAELRGEGEQFVFRHPAGTFLSAVRGIASLLYFAPATGKLS